MAENGSGQRAFLMSWIVLLGVGLFLGVRSCQVASAVLSGDRADQAAAPQSITEGDSLASHSLAASAAPPCARNPFSEASAHVVDAEQPRRAEHRPVARFLLVDRSDRVVQIAVGDSLSPRLHEGDKFLGWTVVAIHPSSVTVSRAGRSVALSSP